MKKILATFDEKKIDAIFADIDRCNLPGAAVGIAIDGKPVYRKGFGLANMEIPILLSPSIRMRIYSTTKHFTCLAYMLLCEEGKAEIDDPIGKYLPELHLVTRQVTLRHLMGNTGGLRDSNDIIWQFNGTGWNVTADDQVSVYRNTDDVNFAQGTHWCYCNGGFVLLTAAIERIAGESLENVLRKRIFEPTGMADTLLRRFDTDFVPNSASMHMVKQTGGYERSYLGPMSGEGGIVSTVNDMLRWLAHMDAPVVGSAKTWEVMKAPQVLTNGASTDYGLGLFSGRYRGVATLHHGGGGMGANSLMLKVPSAGLDVVIMVNRHEVNGSALVDRILDACLPALEPMEVPTSPYPPIMGTFLSPASGRVIQLRTASSDSPWYKAGQQIAVIDGADIPIQTDRRGGLLPARPFDKMMKVAMVPNGDPQAPATLRLTDYGNGDELIRQAPPQDIDVSSIVGLYRSDSTDSEAIVSQTDAGPYLYASGSFGSVQYTLECLAEGIWRAQSTGPHPFGGILLFDKDATTFRFSTRSNRLLLFRQ